MNITEAIEEVRASGRKASQHERKTEIIPAICSIGSHVRQGDILLTFCDPKVDRGEVTEQRQLAPGNTQGSRHIVEGDVTVHARRGDALTGPLLIVGKGGCTVTHPEHRHYVLPEGAWAVTYERDLEQEFIARVAD